MARPWPPWLPLILTGANRKYAPRLGNAPTFVRFSTSEIPDTAAAQYVHNAFASSTLPTRGPSVAAHVMPRWRNRNIVSAFGAGHPSAAPAIGWTMKRSPAGD